MSRYRIKTTTAGHELWQDGAWLETFPTREAAEAEQRHRQEFDRQIASRTGAEAQP